MLALPCRSPKQFQGSWRGLRFFYASHHRLYRKRFCGVRDRHAMDYQAIVELRSYFPFVDSNIRKDHGCNLDRIVFV
jgi:hypothetical protein